MEPAEKSSLAMGPGLRLFSQGALLLALPLLWWARPTNPVGLPESWSVPLHSVAEILAVVIAACIFITGWHVRAPSRRLGSLTMASAFFAVALLDLAHLLSFPGMPAFFTDNSAHKGLIFWLAARYATAIALLAYALLPDRTVARSEPVRYLLLGLALVLVGTCLALGILAPERVPQTFIPGEGPTPFKQAMESGVAVLLALSLLVIVVRRRGLDSSGLPALIPGVALLLVSTAFVLVYRHPTDSANALGHVYKAAGLILLYRAMFLEAVRAPLDQLGAAVAHARRSSRQYQSLLENAPDAILLVDGQGRIDNCNGSTERLFGYSKEHLLGQTVELLIPEQLRSAHRMRRQLRASNSSAAAMRGMRDIVGRHRDGSSIPIDVALGPDGSGTPDRVVAFIRDMRERDRLQKELHQQARADALTGLPNRLQFGEQLERMIRLNAPPERLGVVLIDLDDFRAVNDSWGHDYGDRFLALVAQRIACVLHGGGVLARMGGDEFAALISEMPGGDSAEDVAAALLRTLEAPFTLDSHEAFASASLGVAVYPDDADSPTSLLRRADLALYRAKSEGRGCVRRFRPDFEAHISDNLELQVLLREALADEQFELHFQPQLDADTSRVCGAEALLRWQHPRLGNIPPSRFVPVAEASGLIVAIGNWVLDAACRQIGRFQRGGYALRVAVNVSAYQLQQYDVVERVQHALQRHEVPAELLELELTESAVMRDPEHACRVLADLQELGVQIALDDFGTGYSSLAYLMRFPLNKLKIDRSFVVDLETPGKGAAVLRGLIGLAHSLGLSVTAEGVETDDQLRSLVDCGCDAYQGWLYSAALPADRLLQLLSCESSRPRHCEDGCLSHGAATIGPSFGTHHPGA